MKKPITQREARRLKRRVAELEDVLRKQSHGWRSDWPGGVHLSSRKWESEQPFIEAIRTARKLGHAVVVTEEHDAKTIHFYACELPEQP